MSLLLVFYEIPVNPPVLLVTIIHLIHNAQDAQKYMCVDSTIGSHVEPQNTCVCVFITIPTADNQPHI